MEVPTLGNCLYPFISARSSFAVLGFTGISIIQGLMINLPTALLESNRWCNDWDKYCFDFDRYPFQKKIKPDIDEWTKEQLAIVYSSYFFGYLLSHLLMGSKRLARSQLSPKWVIFWGMALNIMCTGVTPILADVSYFAIVILRFLMGLGGGVILPAFNIMLSKWTLPEDRSRMRALVHTSTLLGFCVSILLTGLYNIAFNWSSVFYIMAVQSTIWWILWLVWARDSPQEQPYISNEERDLIVTALEHKEYETAHQDTPVPWGQVFTSKPFFATLISYVSCYWGFYVLLFQLPGHLNNERRLYVIEVALTVSLSLLGAWLFNIALTKWLNWLKQNNVIETLTGRKIATTFGTIFPAIFLYRLSTGFVGPGDYVLRIVLTVFTIMSTGGMYYGFHSNYYEIAPNFADNLTDLTDTIVIIIQIMVPISIAGLTSDDAYRSILYILTATLYLFAFIVFLLFASVDEEPFNMVAEEDDEPDKNHVLRLDYASL